MAQVNVVISADDGDLRAKLATSQSALREFNSEVRALADQMRAAGDDAKEGLNEELIQAATAAAGAKTEIALLNKELVETGKYSNVFTTMREGVEGVSTRIGAITGAFGALSELFLAGFAVDKIIDMAKETAEWGDALQKASEETGVSVANLSALNVAADHADVSFDTLQRGLAKFSTSMQEGIRGTGLQAAAFQALGIDADYLSQHSNDAAGTLQLVADRLDQYGNGANKEAIVTALFGGKLRDLQPILSDLAQNGFAGLQEKASAAGVLMGGEFAKSAKKAHDQLVDFHEAWKSLEITVSSGVLMRGITNAAESLSKMFNLGSSEMQLSDAQTRLVAVQETVNRLKAAIPQESGFAKWFDQYHLTSAQRDLKELTDEVFKLDAATGKSFDAVGIEGLQVQAIKTLDDFKADAPAIGELTEKINDSDRSLVAFAEHLHALQVEFTEMGVKGAAEFDKLQLSIDRTFTHAAEVTEKTGQEASQIADSGWNKLGTDLEHSFNSSLAGILRGTTTWQQAMGQVFTKLATDFIGEVAKMIAEYAIFEATSGSLGKDPFSGGGGASSTMGPLVSILTEWLGLTTVQEASTSANTFSLDAMGANVGLNTSALALNTAALTASAGAGGGGGIASLATLISVPMLDVGAWSIPQNTLAFLHAGEMVVPAAAAGGARSTGSIMPFPSIGGSIGASGAASAVTASTGDTFHITIQAMDSTSVSRLFQQNGSALVTALQRQIPQRQFAGHAMTIDEEIARLRGEVAAARGVMLGVMDALVGLGVALDAADVVSRSGLARAMEGVLLQQAQRDGGVDENAAFAPKTLKRFFEARVIKGRAN